METQLYLYPATKVVNIYPTNGPITNINPPIRVVTRRTYKVLEDIRRCLVFGAMVGEIMPDGSELMLDMTNYNNDNRTAKGFQANPAGLTSDYFSVDVNTKDLNGDGIINSADIKAKENNTPSVEYPGHHEGGVQIDEREKNGPGSDRGDGLSNPKNDPSYKPSTPYKPEENLPEFDDSDVNHDGVVDNDDMVPEVTGEEEGEVFHPYDTNKDGYVDDAEYEAATGKKRPHGKRK